MSLSHARLDAIVRGEDAPAPFIENLILPTLKEWEPGRALLEWEVDPRTHNYNGVVFGGQLAAMADRALALTTLTVLGDDERFSTSELRSTFFRPVITGTLRIEGTVVNRGRRLIHVEVLFSDEAGTLVHKATATQVVLPNRGESAPEAG